jgi:hypothetical protein
LITNGCESPFLYIPWYCHSVGLQKRWFSGKCKLWKNTLHFLE